MHLRVSCYRHDLAAPSTLENFTRKNTDRNTNIYTAQSDNLVLVGLADSTFAPLVGKYCHDRTEADFSKYLYNLNVFTHFA